MSEWAMKRFWKAASVAEKEAGFAVELDGRGVRTPAKAPLILPTQALAHAVAAEWDAQEDKVLPASMPFTRMANSAIDKVQVQFDEIASMLAEYGDSDLLCYRADGPEALVERQAEVWDPYLDWAATALGARLVPVSGLMHRPQDAAALETLLRLTRSHHAFELAAFHDLVSLTGSLILGFAAARGFAAPETLWEVSRLDELWQIEQWGDDEEAAELAERKKGEFQHACTFFAMSRAL